MLKVIIFTSLLVCAAIAYAADANEPQKEHHNKHHLEHSKQLGEHHQHRNLEQQDAVEQHLKHKKNVKNTLNKSEHGTKPHMQHGKVKATGGQAPRRLRKPQREEPKKNGEGKVKHSRAGEARTAGQKRKHAKHGHEGQERSARGRKVHQ